MNQVDYTTLLETFSVPRPNGSRGERATAQKIQEWLMKNHIPYKIQEFRCYPFFFESIGAWLIASRLLLALSVSYRWGWITLVIALISLPGGLVDVAFHFPLITWPGYKKSINIIVEYVPEKVNQELIVCAHYDSKTELLDHRKRMFLLQNIPTGIILTLVLGILGYLEGYLLTIYSQWANAIYWISILLMLPMLFLSLGLGLNLTIGRLLTPSQGSVDDGSACSILLGFLNGLYHGYYDEKLGSNPARKCTNPLNTKVSVVFFSGEEVNMQGSRAYIKGRTWVTPVQVVNLEVMAQNGEYVIWEQDGTIFKRLPTSSHLNQSISRAVKTVTQKTVRFAGPITSDGGSFVLAGIPATTLGTYHAQYRDAGFHRPTDNPDRIVISRLPEGVMILNNLLMSLDNKPKIGNGSV